jgi:CNT family concentrative nucleoside transporter
VDILTYALCGFSNFSCIGIQIGGIGALVPEKREWLTQLGLYAVLGGALSNLLSAMIASLLL